MREREPRETEPRVPISAVLRNWLCAVAALFGMVLIVMGLCFAAQLFGVA